MTCYRAFPPGILALLLAGCGGGGSGASDGTPPILSDEALPADAEAAGYSVKLESFWFVDDFPQGFPDNAHLSHIGGATHNAAVSFWEVGETITRGMEDVAESGRIEIFLDEEIRPAIENGTADSAIARREFIFSSPRTFDLGLVNEATFDIAVKRDWPLVTLVTMLGPSPDWFVGVGGLPLYEDGAWHDLVTIDLPLFDGGTKSSVEPIMGGPDIRPPIPIALVAYDAATGTYQPTDTPQNIARLTFTRQP